MREFVGPVVAAILVATGVALWPDSHEAECSDCIQRPFGEDGTLLLRQGPGATGPAVGCDGACSVLWMTPHVGFLPEAPRNASQANWFNVTFYAFEAGGELVASNGDTAGYDLYGDYVHIEQRRWSAEELRSAFTDYDLRIPLVEAGSVVRFVVADHEYDWLVGTLYVVARVDATA